MAGRREKGLLGRGNYMGGRHGVCYGEKGESSHTQDLPAGFAVGKVAKTLNRVGHFGQKHG